MHHKTFGAFFFLSKIFHYTSEQRNKLETYFSFTQRVAKETSSSEETKINFQDTKPNLKPPCLFQSSQLGITKLQCFNCNSSRSSRRRVGEMTDELRNFEQVMQKGVGEGLRYNSTLCGKK